MKSIFGLNEKQMLRVYRHVEECSAEENIAECLFRRVDYDDEEIEEFTNEEMDKAVQYYVEHFWMAHGGSELLNETIDYILEQRKEN